ncbi:hypothetical protein RIR_jg42228.t1 [Rhizophagus irregularis DAOM 181602=DAOM 197198]|nr:hypothetical protein RIR_jg42228.t1 [Rhizophagus irregularis DAOM 181602=DAOM 197198]
MSDGEETYCNETKTKLPHAIKMGIRKLKKYNSDKLIPNESNKSFRTKAKSANNLGWIEVSKHNVPF